jgi:HlyD family secretion protein
MNAKIMTAALLGGVLLLGCVLWGQTQHNSTSNAAENKRFNAESAVTPIAVHTQTIRPVSIADILELPGILKPVKIATVSTRVSGRVTMLSVEEGDRVRRGQILAKVDVNDLSAQVTQANAGVQQAQANLRVAQASLLQQHAQRQEAQAALNLAKLNQSRMAELFKEGAVAQAQLDQTTASLALAEAKFAQVNASIRQAQASITQSEAAINSSKSGLNTAAASASYGTIVAPFDGVVVEKLASEGETTNMFGTPLLKLERTDLLRLEVPVPEGELNHFSLNQSVQVRIDSLGRRVAGRIQQIVPAADSASHSFIVKIPLANQDGKLMSGMFARLELSRGSQQVFRVPASSLVQRGQLQGIYVVGADKRAELRWIKTGKTEGTQVQIQSGLSAGERVILAPSQSLSDGQAVTFTEEKPDAN